jgi:type I restriction enzyme R subunit
LGFGRGRSTFRASCALHPHSARSYTASQTAVWRQTLEHFDAIKIGLTATPAAHTTAYFKEVVYRYEYERAVREGFLVDYDVVKIKSNVRIQGIFDPPAPPTRTIQEIIEDIWQNRDRDYGSKKRSPRSPRSHFHHRKAAVARPYPHPH